MLAQTLEVFVHLGDSLTVTLARRLLRPLLLVLGHVGFAPLLRVCPGVCRFDWLLLFVLLEQHRGVWRFSGVCGHDTSIDLLSIGLLSIGLLLALLLALLLDGGADAALERELSAREHPSVLRALLLAIGIRHGDVVQHEQDDDREREGVLFDGRVWDGGE